MSKRTVGFYLMFPILFFIGVYVIGGLFGFYSIFMMDDEKPYLALFWVVIGFIAIALATHLYIRAAFDRFPLKKAQIPKFLTPYFVITAIAAISALIPATALEVVRDNVVLGILASVVRMLIPFYNPVLNIFVASDMLWGESMTLSPNTARLILGACVVLTSLLHMGAITLHMSKIQKKNGF